MTLKLPIRLKLSAVCILVAMHSQIVSDCSVRGAHSYLSYSFSLFKLFQDPVDVNFIYPLILFTKKD